MIPNVPKKPDDARHRVFHGGSCCTTTAVSVRASVRDGGDPAFRHYYLCGFRIALAGRAPRA